MARLGVSGYNDQRDAGAIAEKVQRLHIAGIIVAAAFIHGDENRGVTPKGGIAFHGVHEFLHEAFK